MIQFKPLAIAAIEKIVPMMQEFYAIDNYPNDINVSKALFEEFINHKI